MKALVDYRIKEKYREYIENLGLDVILVKSKSVYDEVSGHPDIFAINVFGRVFVAENIDLDNYNNVIISEKVENGYPDTSKYNVCISENYAVCNEKYISKDVLKEINEHNLKILNVKQGYSRCSCIALKNDSFITSDKGIIKVLRSEGLNVFEAPYERINLLDLDGNFSKMNGFIGGATFVYEDKFILFGDKDKLKCGNDLKEFVENLGYEFIDFKGEEIIDYGSVIVI